jgi:site-specific DNA-methyltransferase (adenine-specific)
MDIEEPTYRVIEGDNLAVLRALPAGCVDLVYLDPPFNTGARQRLRSLAMSAVPEAEAADPGVSRGFGGRPYRASVRSSASYADQYDDYLAFLLPRLTEIRRVLRATGSMYLHLDPRESHYAKVACDQLFGRDSFINEVIWAYDFGGRGLRRWPAKHDTILWYAKEASSYYFDLSASDRLPYLAPGLVGAEKSARGKTPTDVWWSTIVPTSGHERTGYPTQKPLSILRRIVASSCPPGGLVLDPFAGSGTTGAAAAELSRRFLLIDQNPQAIAVMRRRFAALPVSFESPPA